MKLKLVKASQGVIWVRQGVLACRQQTLGFVGLVGLSGFLMLLLLGLPESIGPKLFVAITPMVWLGFMQATRRVVRGERITPMVMIEAIKAPDAPRLDFALLGVAYVFVTLLMLQLAQWLGPDPEALEAIMSSNKDAAEVLSNPLVQQDMLWHMILTVPVSLIFLHTPALVSWSRLSVPKAIFFSTVASWKNLGAFCVFGACWMGVMATVALIGQALMMLLPVPAVANVLLVAGGMWVAAAFYASLYFAVVDCFEPQSPEPA
jgi:hypothetical protein